MRKKNASNRRRLPTHFTKFIFLTVILLSTQLCSQTQLDEIYGEAHLSRDGNSTAISRDGLTIALGATNYNGVGRVRVFRYDAQRTRSLLGSAIDGSASGDAFGTAIAMNSDGDRIIIGAPDNDSNGNNSGHVKIYHLIANTWTLKATITGETSSDRFGLSVSMSSDGTTIAAGAPEHNSKRGYVKVYRYNSQTDSWAVFGSETEGDNDTTDYINQDISDSYFGGAVSLNGDGTRLVIGAHRQTVTKGVISIYQYTSGDGSWTNMAGFAGSNISDNLGYSVAMNEAGDRCIAGAPYYGNNVGQARVYSYNGTSWSQLGANINSSSGNSDYFGWAVSINNLGDRVAIGATWQGNTSSGRTEVYDYSSGWTQFRTIQGTANEQLRIPQLNGFGNKILIGGAFSSDSDPYDSNSVPGVTRLYDLQNINSYTAASGDWSNTSNWSMGRIPNSDDNIILNSGTTLSLNTDVTLYDVTINSGATLTIAATNSLTLKANLIQNGTMTIENGGSLSVDATSFGDITYSRTLTHTNNSDLTKNWYLVSSAFAGETIEDLRTNNSFASGSNSNIGIAYYNNNTPAWSYQTNSSTGTISSGSGLSIRLADSGTIRFTGTMNTSDVAVNLTNGSSNAFNLIGNPYPSYIPVNDNANGSYNIFRANGTNSGSNEGNIVLAEDTIWLWNQATGSYTALNLSNSATYIAPGQGFFVKTISGGGSFNFTETMQTHQSSDTFQKSSSMSFPSITINLSNGKKDRASTFNFFENVTTEFDNGYDSTLFGGEDLSFTIYSQLLSNNIGQLLAVQSLPISMLKSTRIPLGIHAKKRSVLSFSAKTSNIPDDIEVILEDSFQHKFYKLHDNQSMDPIPIQEDQKGVGRFYLHTTKNENITLEEATLDDIGIYQTHSQAIRIEGLNSGNVYVDLYSIEGKKVVTTQFQASGIYDIQLPKLASGLYLIKISHKQRILTKKLMLN